MSSLDIAQLGLVALVAAVGGGGLSMNHARTTANRDSLYLLNLLFSLG